MVRVWSREQIPLPQFNLNFTSFYLFFNPLLRQKSRTTVWKPRFTNPWFSKQISCFSKTRIPWEQRNHQISKVQLADFTKDPLALYYKTLVRPLQRTQEYPSRTEVCLFRKMWPATFWNSNTITSDRWQLSRSESFLRTWETCQFGLFDLQHVKAQIRRGKVP